MEKQQSFDEFFKLDIPQAKSSTKGKAINIPTAPKRLESDETSNSKPSERSVIYQLPGFKEKSPVYMQIDLDETEDSDPIRNYDARDLIACGPFRSRIGTVFDSTFIWVQIILMLIVAIIIAIITLIVCSHEDLVGTDVSRLEKMASYMNSLVGFVLGLFVALTLSRWWSMRHDCLGLLWGSIADISSYSAILFSAQDPRNSQIKDLVLRYGLASHALLFKTCQGTDNNMEDMIDRGLLTPEEAESLVGHVCKPALVWVWLMAMIMELAKADKIPYANRTLVHIQSIILHARTSINETFTYIFSPLPLVYVHMLALIVKLNFILLTFKAGVEIAYGISLGNPMIVVVNLIELIIIPIVYQGLLEVQEQLKNPFGTDKNDFPYFAFHCHIRDECRAYFDAGENIPLDIFQASQS